MRVASIDMKHISPWARAQLREKWSQSAGQIRHTLIGRRAHVRTQHNDPSRPFSLKTRILLLLIYCPSFLAFHARVSFLFAGPNAAQHGHHPHPGRPAGAEGAPHWGAHPHGDTIPANHFWWVSSKSFYYKWTKSGKRNPEFCRLKLVCNFLAILH